MALQEEFEKQGNFLFKYRGILPVLILIPAFYMQWIKPSELKDGHFSYELLCLFVGLFGLLIRILAVGYSAKNTSGRNTSEGQIADEINTTCLYSMVRHPLYLGNFFMWLSLAMLTHHTAFILIFCLMYWLYYERIMYAEEQFLRKKFGPKYIAWSDTVPAFIPALTKWKCNGQSFSFKKIIRQEKTGIMLLFGLFFVFKAIDSYTSYQTILPEQPVWFILMLFGVVYYVVIKLLTITTKIFS